MAEAQSSLTGAWSGKYTYLGNRSAPVAFSAFLEERASTLFGETIEPNTFHPAPTDTLMAALSGSRDEFDVSFSKTYTDVENGVLRYFGTLNDKLTRISGRWVFPDTPFVQGGFVMIRDRLRSEQSVRITDTANL